MPQLANSASGSLFTIPASDWTTINKRVGLAISEANISSAIAETIPAFPALLTSCKLWQSSTFDQLIEQANKLAEYAAMTIKDFNNLESMVMKLKGTTVSEEVKLMTTLNLKSLAKRTSPLTTSFSTLSAQVQAFMDINQKVDTQMAAHASQFGSFWKPMGAEIKAVNTSAGKIVSVWKSLSNDLNIAVAKPIAVTMPYIESLNIKAAIISWKNLQKEADAFSTMAAKQKQYWKNPLKSVSNG